MTDISTSLALDTQRENYRIAQAEKFDIADISEAEFAHGIERMKVTRTRLETIMRELLIEGQHYGNPEANGRKAFDKPILLASGADVLQRAFGLAPVIVGEPVVVESAEYVSVRVTVAMRDRVGNTFAHKSASCSTAERRFQKFNGSGATFRDAREKLNDCLSMATKRAEVRATAAATGARAIFSDEDVLEKTVNEKPITPWSAAEKKATMEAAAKKGMNRAMWAEFVRATLGRTEIASEDVPTLLAALKDWTPPRKTEVGIKTEADPYATNQQLDQGAGDAAE